MVHLKDELGACFKTREEEKEARIKQLTEELNGARQKVRRTQGVHRHMLQMLLLCACKI